MSDVSINPFTYLVRVTTQPPKATEAPGRLPANSRPLEALLQLLDENVEMSTPQLSDATGLHSRLAQGLRTLGLEGAGRRMRNLDAEALARLTQVERRAVGTFLRDVASRINWEGEPCEH
jgi:hypothetical protein